VTVALSDLRGQGRCLGQDRPRTDGLDRSGLSGGRARVRRSGRVPARSGEALLEAGNGANGVLRTCAYVWARSATDWLDDGLSFSASERAALAAATAA
jgi:hypothetical protein